MDGRACCSFEKIVDYGGDYEFVADFVEVDDAFVGVDHVFEVDRAVAYKGEVMVAVKLVEKMARLAEFERRVHIDDRHYTACKRATHRYEVDLLVESVLNLGEGLTDIVKMMMGQTLVDR